MKRFNSNKVGSLHLLVPATDKQKAVMRRLNGIQMPFSKGVGPAQPKVVKVREDFLAPIKPDFVPRKPRGRSGCRMSDAVRKQLAERKAAREAFFRSL